MDNVDLERELFVAERRAGIGSADIAPIVGLDPYRTALDVYFEKTRPQDDSDDREMQSGHVARGVYMEARAAEAYAERTGYELSLERQHVHPTYEWARCHPDRAINLGGNPGVAEIKCPAVWQYRRYVKDGPTPGIILQHQWQLGVTGRDWGEVVAFHADFWNDAPSWSFGFSRALWERMVNVAGEFWHDHVLAGVPPGLEERSEAVSDLLPRPEGTMRVSDSEWVRSVHLLKVAREARDTGKEVYKSAVKRVKSMMAEHAAVDVEGVGRVRWGLVEPTGPGSVDLEALESAAPVDYDKALALVEQLVGSRQRAIDALAKTRLDLARFTQPRKPYRPFTFYPEKRKPLKGAVAV